MGLPSASLLLEGSKTLRNAADVAAEANTDNFNGYAGKRAGGWSGTSFAAPRWAGYLAPTIRCTRESHAGLVNPTIYSRRTFTTSPAEVIRATPPKKVMT